MISNLFGFNQAQELQPSRIPSGHYDAEQQLWIVDETSYANTELMPVDCPSTTSTYQISVDSSGPSVTRDFALD